MGESQKLSSTHTHTHTHTHMEVSASSSLLIIIVIEADYSVQAISPYENDKFRKSFLKFGLLSKYKIYIF